MSTNLRDFTKAAHTLDAVVQRVPADTWDRQSPCVSTGRRAKYSATWRGVSSGSPPVTLGSDPPAEPSESDVAGDDPVATWNEAPRRCRAAVDRPAALDRSVTGSFGTATIDGVLGYYPSDLMAHAWGIATTAQGRCASAGRSLRAGRDRHRWRRRRGARTRTDGGSGRSSRRR